jgi:hypothetical protein
MNPLTNHPNASLSLVASLGLGSLFVQLGNKWGLHLSTQDGVYIAGGFSVAFLYLGRHGIVGTWNFVKNVVLHGTSGKPAAKAKS